MLDIRNFRAFAHAELAVPDSGPLLVAGANNAGKSALLSAIDVIATGEQVPESVHYGATGPTSIAATFALDDDERDALWSEAEAVRTQHRNAFQTISFDFKYPGAAPLVQLAPVRLSTFWPPPLGDVVLVEYVVEGGRAVVRRNDAARLLAGDAEPRPNFRIGESGSGNLDASGLKAYTHAMGEFQPIISFLSTWAAGIYHFKALRPGTLRDSHQISGAERLDPTGQNLPAVLTHLYHNQRAVYEQLNQLLQRIIPDIGTLELPLTGDQTQITFRDPTVPDRTLNLKRLGTGVEQLLMTLVVGLTGGGPSGVIIEEPETNLHPGAQRALLALIREWSVDRPYLHCYPLTGATGHRSRGRSRARRTSRGRIASAFVGE